MKAKKIIALLLIAIMAFNLAGCGSANKSTSKTIARILKAVDYEEMEEKDFNLGDMKQSNLGGCFFTLTDEDNIENLADIYHFDDEDVKSALVGWKVNPNHYGLNVEVYEFYNEDDAQNFYGYMTSLFEQQINMYEENGIEVERNEDDDFFQYAYVEIEDHKDGDVVHVDLHLTFYYDLRINDTEVSVIEVYIPYNENYVVISDMRYICEALKIDSPTNLI